MSVKDGVIHTEKYRCVDDSGEEPIYQRQSEWTSSEDVYMRNGLSLENQMKKVSKIEDVEQLSVYHDVDNGKDDIYSVLTDYFYGIEVTFSNGVAHFKLNDYTNTITKIENLVYVSAQSINNIIIYQCWIQPLDGNSIYMSACSKSGELFTGTARINLMAVFKQNII